jgi:vacuolar-type H+-ATPase subunit H
VPDERIPTARRPASGSSAADRVASIISAAEAAAEEIREHAESRVRDRIAEADRAATNRVTAAEEEAAEIIANARRQSETLIAEALEAADRTRQEAEQLRRELLEDARATAQGVRREGLELVGNLRQTGDSLRTNAARLLGDVQTIHSQMVARIDRAEANGLPGRPPRASRSVPFDGRARPDLPDVPEFIPRR